MSSNVQTKNAFSTSCVVIATITVKMTLMRPTVRITTSQPPAMTDDVHENVTVIKDALTAVTKPTVQTAPVTGVLILAECTPHFKGATASRTALTAATKPVVPTTTV